MVQRVDPAAAAQALSQGRAVLVDVREPGEHASERVEGARLAPLSIFEHAARTLPKDKPLLLLCARGARAQACAERLAASGFSDVAVIEGGLEGWKARGLPVVAGERRVWSMDRQVRFAAGSLVLAGVLLGAFARPAFYALAGFVGAGLVFSGLTDFCGMALLLARMPWNKGRGASCSGGGC